MQEIYKYIDCISQICKKYAVKICGNMQFYMQHMQKSIYCIFCIYMHSPLCWWRQCQWPWPAGGAAAYRLWPSRWRLPLPGPGQAYQWVSDWLKSKPEVIRVAGDASDSGSPGKNLNVWRLATVCSSQLEVGKDVLELDAVQVQPEYFQIQNVKVKLTPSSWRLGTGRRRAKPTSESPTASGTESGCEL